MTVHLSQNMLNVLRGKRGHGPFSSACGRRFDHKDVHRYVLAWYFTDRNQDICGINQDKTPNDAWKLVDCPLCFWLWTQRRVRNEA